MSITTKANLTFQLLFSPLHSDNCLRPVLQGIFRRIKIPCLNLDNSSEKVLPLCFLKQREEL